MTIEYFRWESDEDESITDNEADDADDDEDNLDPHVVWSEINEVLDHEDEEWTRL